MKLDEAFDAAIRKFYEGFEYSESSKMDPRLKDYSYGALDTLHKEIVPKKKPIEMPEEEVVEDVI